jgi:hypothetical protein
MALLCIIKRPARCSRVHGPGAASVEKCWVLEIYINRVDMVTPSLNPVIVSKLKSSLGSVFMVMPLSVHNANERRHYQGSNQMNSCFDVSWISHCRELPFTLGFQSGRTHQIVFPGRICRSAHAVPPQCVLVRIYVSGTG